MATIQELGIRLTSPEVSYWNHKGAYQTEGDALYEKLVPASGAAETVHGELIRGINRLTHEYLNNGNCNACLDNSPYCDDDDEEYGTCLGDVREVEVDPYYAKFLNLMRTELPNKIDEREVEHLTDAVEEIILAGADDLPCSIYMSKQNVNAYSRMCDVVIWYVLNTEDSPLPYDYVKE